MSNVIQLFNEHNINSNNVIEPEELVEHYTKQYYNVFVEQLNFDGFGVDNIKLKNIEESIRNVLKEQLLINEGE